MCWDVLQVEEKVKDGDGRRRHRLPVCEEEVTVVDPVVDGEVDQVEPHIRPPVSSLTPTPSTLQVCPTFEDDKCPVSLSLVDSPPSCPTLVSLRMAGTSHWGPLGVEGVIRFTLTVTGCSPLST